MATSGGGGVSANRLDAAPDSAAPANSLPSQPRPPLGQTTHPGIFFGRFFLFGAESVNIYFLTSELDLSLLQAKVGGGAFGLAGPASRIQLGVGLKPLAPWAKIEPALPLRQPISTLSVRCIFYPFVSSVIVLGSPPQGQPGPLVAQLQFNGVTAAPGSYGVCYGCVPPV